MDIGDGAHRVDLHPRLSRSGRLVSIDASHEGLGRQMYVIDIRAYPRTPAKLSVFHAKEKCKKAR